MSGYEARVFNLTVGIAIDIIILSLFDWNYNGMVNARLVAATPITRCNGRITF
jgi:hypothetical protein